MYIFINFRNILVIFSPGDHPDDRRPARLDARPSYLTRCFDACSSRFASPPRNDLEARVRRSKEHVVSVRSNENYT